ncbi:MAG: GtrA family protein [Treponema sp.]|nr:GtrA family protein [Treponema sp.]
MKFTVLFDMKLCKFIFVGIINTIAGSALMFSLYNFAHLSYWFSSACNYCLISILSFFLNKYITFDVRRWSVFMVIAFALTIAFSYLIAYGISKPALNHFLRDSPQKIRENVALFTGMCLFTGINYLGQRFVVFKNKKEIVK